MCMEDGNFIRQYLSLQVSRSSRVYVLSEPLQPYLTMLWRHQRNQITDDLRAIQSFCDHGLVRFERFSDCFQGVSIEHRSAAGFVTRGLPKREQKNLQTP